MVCFIVLSGYKFGENVILLFQPAHCPELNPIERVWEHLKRDLRWELFNNLEELQRKVTELLDELSEELLASLTSYDFIIEAIANTQIT
jgi:transposase